MMAMNNDNNKRKQTHHTLNRKFNKETNNGRFFVIFIRACCRKVFAI